MSSKHKKVLLLTEMEQGIEPIIQQVTNIQQENMLTIHSYDSVIVHPFGDIMRSIIIAIYEENVEELRTWLEKRIAWLDTQFGVVE